MSTELTHPTAVQLGISRLYHYEKFCPEWLAATLRDQRIHCSNPATLNDPWDCRPRFDNRPHRYNPDELRDWSFGIADPPLTASQKADFTNRLRSSDYIQKFIDGFSDSIQRVIAELRVYCLTPDPCSSLMWSHYANNHRGICLEFATDNPLFDQAQRVDYSLEYPVWLPHQEEEKTAWDLLLTKSDDWEHEREFRVVGVREARRRSARTRSRLTWRARAMVSICPAISGGTETSTVSTPETVTAIGFFRIHRFPASQSGVDCTGARPVNLKTMEMQSLQLPVDLLTVVGEFGSGDVARETARLLALELFREDKISLGRAAELCHTPIEAFMEFAAEHGVPLHYGIAELDEDRRTLAKLRA